MNNQRFRLWLLDLDPERAHRIDGTHAILAWEKTLQLANAVGQRRDNHRPMRNALIAGHADFRVDPLGSLDAQIHGVKTMLNVRLAMRDGKGKLLAKSQHPVSGIWYP